MCVMSVARLDCIWTLGGVCGAPLDSKRLIIMKEKAAGSLSHALRIFSLDAAA